MSSFKPFMWRTVFTVLGFITAVSCLTLGFLRTMLVLLCCFLGYIIGIHKDKNIRLAEWFKLLQSRIK